MPLFSADGNKVVPDTQCHTKNKRQLLCRTVANTVCLIGFVCGFCLRKVTKESLVETSSNITESLMAISRMMSEQVKQSEDTIGVLGKKKIILHFFVYIVRVRLSTKLKFSVSPSLLNL